MHGHQSHFCGGCSRFMQDWLASSCLVLKPMLLADSLWQLCRRPKALRRQERRLDITQRPGIIRQGAHLQARKRLRHLLQRGASGHAAGTALTESQVLHQGEADALPCNKHLGCAPPPICAALQA